MDGEQLVAGHRLYDGDRWRRAAVGMAQIEVDQKLKGEEEESSDTLREVEEEDEKIIYFSFSFLLSPFQ